MSEDQQEDFVELAFRYRNGLEKMYWLVAQNERCECDFVPNWTQLMNDGVPHNSKELRKHEHICLFCRSEYIYAETIGEKLFTEQMSARIMAFLDDTFEDPVAIMVTDEDGVEQIRMIEREELKKLEEHFEIIDYNANDDDDI